MDSRKRSRREPHRRAAARDRQPVLDVRGRFLTRQRLEVVPNRHTLIELPQFGPPQQTLQVRLADEHDLEQLLLLRFEIRQNPDLLKDLERQVLRLVDDQHSLRADPLQ
jgi:hypothetical protein